MTNKQPTIQVLLEKARLAAGGSGTVNVLVRIIPPAVSDSGGGRPKLNLSIVLDRSGSMQGRKLQEAKAAAGYCVDQLLPTDRISAIIFDDEVDVLIPSQTVENKELLKRAINSVQTNGSTALHDGWVRGGLKVSEHLNGDGINRVLLITDGQANVGETRVHKLVDQARELAARNVTTSTIGIGRDFNEDLLLPMAEAGQGNSWHVEEPQDMVKIFQTELHGLINQVAHSVTLAIKPLAGAVVKDVLNDFETDTSGRCRLPNLRAGAPLDVVVRFSVPAGDAGRSIELAEFTLAYIDQESGEQRVLAATFAAIFDTPEAIESLVENAEVARAVQLLMNARARREAMVRMDQNDYTGAHAALLMAADDTGIMFARASSPELAEELRDLDDLKQLLESRANDSISRKKLAYRSEALRKNK